MDELSGGRFIMGLGAGKAANTLTRHTKLRRSRPPGIHGHDPVSRAARLSPMTVSSSCDMPAVDRKGRGLYTFRSTGATGPMLQDDGSYG